VSLGGGSPWRGDSATRWWAHSPIAHASAIRTPTLILACTGDERAPITHAYKLFHALDDNGVPVRFVAYPVAAHAPTDPVHQRDVRRRWIDWLAEHLA
jgi:dipeptidyl aminopeptidase/acylaminoacyl peptidase